MSTLDDLSDDDIDSLLLLLFNGGKGAARPKAYYETPATTKSIHEFTHEDLLRIRSRNHPDKWPNVNLEAYQAAVEELDRRRREGG